MTANGIVMFISPKGYGMARLDDGRTAFLPSRLVSGKYSMNDRVMVRVEDGDLPDRYRATSVSKFIPQAILPGY